MNNLHIVSDAETFKETIQSGRCVAYFYADWCGPCRVVAPIFSQISTDYASYKFVKVNIDNLDSIAEMHNIQSIPTFILFEDGNEKERVIGSDTQNLKKTIGSVYK